MRRQGMLAQSIVAVVLMMTATGLVGGPALAESTASSTPPASARPGSGLPQVGDEVAYISESGGTIATVTVTRVEQPWTGYGEYYTPDSGTEYVAFVIELTHQGTRGDLIVQPEDFRLQDADGFLLSRSWANAADNAELKPSSDPVAIAPGATGRVVVVFQVLQGIELSQLLWQPEYDRLITLADLHGLGA